MTHILLSLLMLCASSIIHCADIEQVQVLSIDDSFNYARRTGDLAGAKKILQEATQLRPTLQDKGAQNALDKQIAQMRNYITDMERKPARAEKAGAEQKQLEKIQFDSLKSSFENAARRADVNALERLLKEAHSNLQDCHPFLTWIRHYFFRI